MNELQLKALLSLLLVSDPWPLGAQELENLIEYADEESQKLGFEDWTDALHNL